MGLCRCEKKDTKDFRLSAGNLTETSKKSLGNECNRTQMSALEEHNNSLLHKEALRLQSASKDKNMARQDKPVYVKGLPSQHTTLIDFANNVYYFGHFRSFYFFGSDF